MTNLNALDLQIVTGGIGRMTQNNGSGSAGSYKPEEDAGSTEAK